MAVETTAILEPSTIERLKFPIAHMFIDKGWITIVRIAPETGNIKECVPETIESIETLQYLGLTQNAALQAFSVFADKCGSAEHVDKNFIEWAKQHVESFPDCCADDSVSKWDGAMRIMGVQASWRYAILDPSFDKLRQEHTARYWVIQRMEEKWKHLVELDQRMKSALAEIEAVKHPIEYKAKLLGRRCRQ